MNYSFAWIAALFLVVTAGSRNTSVSSFAFRTTTTTITTIPVNSIALRRTFFNGNTVPSFYQKLQQKQQQEQSDCVISATAAAAAATTTVLRMKDGNRDASRSGTKRERLDKLAELEKDRIDTDKGFVVKAFVALIVILLIVAFTTLEGPI